MSEKCSVLVVRCLKVVVVAEIILKIQNFKHALKIKLEIAPSY